MKLPVHKTKIVCTIGPASHSEAVLEKLMERGMSVARLNFAHGTPEGHGEDIRRIRAVATKLGRSCLTMVDLPGPKIRVGRLSEEPLLLEQGDRVTLTTRKVLGTRDCIPVGYESLPQSVSPGSVIFLNDGFIQLQAERVLGDGVICRTVIGGPLLSHKGLNIPGARSLGDAVSGRDLGFVDFGLRRGIDTFTISFAETAGDILKVREFAEERERSVNVIAKIERAEAVENIDGILEAADAIMIARGDLGVQIPLEDVPAVQKKIIHKANVMGRPVITATQMLVSMTDNIRPTRAEVSDVANAILDGTDAVMLSEETAIGSHPVESVEMMAKIAASAEREREAIRALSDLPAYFREMARSGRATAMDLVSLNAVEAAGALGAGYILTGTRSAPRLISRFKPGCWILSLREEARGGDLLNLSYGVLPVFAGVKAPNRVDVVLELVEDLGLAEGGQRMVLVEGAQADDGNPVGSLRILRFDKDGKRMGDHGQ